MSTTTLDAEQRLTAAAIRKDFRINDKGKTEMPEDLYEKHLPDDIPLETVNRVFAHNRAFTLAALEAFAEVSESAVKKNKELDRTVVQIPTGDGAHFQAQYVRESKRATTGDDGKVRSESAYGVLTHKFVVNGGNVQDFTSVKERFSKQAKKLFAQ